MLIKDLALLQYVMASVSKTTTAYSLKHYELLGNPQIKR